MIETTKSTKKLRTKTTKEKSEHLRSFGETNHDGAEGFWIPLHYAKRNDERGGCVSRLRRFVGTKDQFEFAGVKQQGARGTS